MNYTLGITNSLDYIEDHSKGLFIDHKILLGLNKFYQYEQSPPQNKDNPNLETDSEKETVRPAISRLIPKY